MKGADKTISIIFLKAHIHSLVCVSSTVATQSPLGGEKASWNQLYQLIAVFLTVHYFDTPALKGT